MNGAALLVFARCAGFVSRAPGLSHPTVPHTVRAGFAAVLAVLLASAARGVHAPDGLMLAAAVAAESGIGAAIGFAASILYDGAYAGGRALDDYVGIRGSMPSAQVFAPAGFGRVWSLAFTAGFFLLGGYRLLILAFARSFERLPPGTFPAVRDLHAYAIALPSSILEAALLVAGPAMAVAFVAQISLGALARVIPRFAAFTLSFPIVFGLALAATLLSVPLLIRASAVPWLHAPFLNAH